MTIDPGMGSIYLIVLLGALGALAISAVLTRHLLAPGCRFLILDHPNERSLHTRPTPRSGGIALLLGMAAGFAVLYAAARYVPILLYPEDRTALGWTIAGISLLAGIAVLDELRPLPLSRRLAGQTLAVAMALLSAIGLPDMLLPGWYPAVPVWLEILLTFLYLVWMVNLYNFMDGIDGLAGGMAVIGFTSFAILGMLAGDIGFTATSLVIACAAGGFLIFNYPPARIFMGDSGSSVLGLLAGWMTLWGVENEIFSLWSALLIFSPFIVDATVTLVRRVLRGERFWEGHKTHYYQLLAQHGWGHRKTTHAGYLLMTACSVSAVIAAQLDTAGQLLLLGGWCLAYGVLIAGMSRRAKPMRKASCA